MGTYTSPIASGGIAPFGVLDVYTSSGTSYHWAERNVQIPGPTSAPLQSGQFVAPAVYQDWLTGQAKFQMNGTTQTDTGSVSVQNISGNTVTRDVAVAFSKFEFVGALVVYRLWRGDAGQSMFTFVGNVNDADIDETQMDLSLEGFGNYSAIIAPFANIDVGCPLSFGSVACGSTSPTPCNQSYGSCSSIERFTGVVIQWDNVNVVASTVQIAQPAPAVERNPARPF